MGRARRAHTLVTAGIELEHLQRQATRRGGMARVVAKIVKWHSGGPV